MFDASFFNLDYKKLGNISRINDFYLVMVDTMLFKLVHLSLESHRILIYYLWYLFHVLILTFIWLLEVLWTSSHE